MQVSAIEGYRLWAPIYDSGPNPLVLLERRSMRDVLKGLRPSKMIDVACGTGRWLLRFQEAGWDVFGCDGCEEMLSEARKILSLRGRVALADAERIPFRGSTADLILCSLSLGYFRDVRQVFREFARASKPGGLIAVSDLHPDALESGWTRSFKLGERRYELEHYRRTIREVHYAASDAGLRTKVFDSAHFGPSDLPAFQRAGREDLFKTSTAIPALFVALWEKPC
ncbi:MAG: class I SAM-dependent methyltransferase [Bryobacteraceae bacterium]